MFLTEAELFLYIADCPSRGFPGNIGTVPEISGAVPKNSRSGTVNSGPDPEKGKWVFLSVGERYR
jgi:hypothetical protein